MLELNEYTTIVIVRCNGVTIRVSVSFFAGITCCVFPSMQTKCDFVLKPLPFNMCFVHVHLEIFTILACAESFYQSQFTRRLVGSIIGTECRIYYYIIMSGNWTNAAEVNKKSWRNLRGWRGGRPSLTHQNRNTLARKLFWRWSEIDKTFCTPLCVFWVLPSP